MNSPVVTVVVPTFGRPAELRSCLDALARQTFAERWEVVVVDDGSPQPLGGLAVDFAGRLDLRVIRQANAGPAAARNRGVCEARGGFVAFTDDDCLPRHDWLATLVSVGRERSDSLIGGATINGLQDELFATTSQLIIDLVYEHFNAAPEKAYFLASNNMFCSRDILLAMGGFDTAFPRAGAEDRDFCDRWRADARPIVWLPAAVIEHRHSQTLAQFLELHYRYGRGAYLYQSKRRQRGSGTMGDDLGFHGSLPRLVYGRLRHHGGVLRRGGLLSALVLWQAANATGFAVEALRAVAIRKGG